MAAVPTESGRASGLGIDRLFQPFHSPEISNLARSKFCPFDLIQSVSSHHSAISRIILCFSNSTLTDAAPAHADFKLDMEMGNLSRMKALSNGWKALLLGTSVFAAVPVGATPALVVDVATQAVLHAEDAGVPWYPASTTKLMTVFVVFEALRSGQVTMDTPVVMSRQAMSQASLEAGLSVGRAMTLEDALFAVIAGSTNDVAVALAETVASNDATFVERMNDAAKRLGLTATHFANPNGLFDRTQHSTARDLALLGIRIDQSFPEYRYFFQAAGVVVDGKEVASSNELLAHFPGTTGMKTGFICASGRNMVALAQRDGRRVMVVLLGATTERERSERTAQFLTQAFDGALGSHLGSLEALPNRPDVQPEDMRLRLCSDQTAAYEAGREAMYPMGLPGHQTFLGPEMPVSKHIIRTWAIENVADVPKPLQRPPLQ